MACLIRRCLSEGIVDVAEELEDHRDHAGPKLQGYEAQNLLMAPRSSGRTGKA